MSRIRRDNPPMAGRRAGGLRPPRGQPWPDIPGGGYRGGSIRKPRPVKRTEEKGPPVVGSSGFGGGSPEPAAAPTSRPYGEVRPGTLVGPSVEQQQFSNTLKGNLTGQSFPRGSMMANFLTGRGNRPTRRPVSGYQGYRRRPTRPWKSTSELIGTRAGGMPLHSNRRYV